MKKLVFPFAVIAVLALASSSLTSCKKDYTCTCTDSVFGTVAYPIDNSKKGDAEDACDALNVSEQLLGGSCDLSN